MQGKKHPKGNFPFGCLKTAALILLHFMVNREAGNFDDLDNSPNFQMFRGG